MSYLLSNFHTFLILLWQTMTLVSFGFGIEHRKINKCISGQKWTTERTNKQTNEHTNKQTNGQTKTLFLMLPYHESGRDLCPLVKLFFLSLSNVRLSVWFSVPHRHRMFNFTFIQCWLPICFRVKERYVLFCFVFCGREREKTENIRHAKCGSKQAIITIHKLQTLQRT